MARKPKKDEMAPSFKHIENSDLITLKYHIKLITPMLGGGVESWEPDFVNPIRSQSVKGQLRFWWRTMQVCNDADILREREKMLWGGPDSGSGGENEGQASCVKLMVRLKAPATKEKNGINYQQGDTGLPDYVLFPLISRDSSQLLKDLQFEVELQVPTANREEVEKSVKLWVLFGGIGARVSRGCGSLYCADFMEAFEDGDEIIRYWRELNSETQQNFGESHYPVISNSRLAVSKPGNETPQNSWNNLLSTFGDFCQKPDVGRNTGHGRTRWPEADAIRRITDTGKNHKPIHPAGNWFPRGAYGLPIQTEFKNDSGDPDGKYLLQPTGSERWPSPVILKVIQLNNKTCLKICLILNHAIPVDLQLLKDKACLHDLTPTEHPMAFDGKTMPSNAEMLHSNENPYDALIRHLDFEEVVA